MREAISLFMWDLKTLQHFSIGLISALYGAALLMKILLPEKLFPGSSGRVYCHTQQSHYAMTLYGSVAFVEATHNGPFSCMTHAVFQCTQVLFVIWFQYCEGFSP